VAAAPGAVNLAAGGGYQAWFAPSEGTGWHLVVRGPGGAATRPAVRGFAGPQQVAIGSDRFGIAGRRLLAVYARDDGDVHALNLRTGQEERVRSISSRRSRESAPAIQYGRFVFVRRGGPRPGIHVKTPGRGARRISAATPRELSSNGTRVAYAHGRSVVVRHISGRGRTLVFRTRSTPHSPALTRYRVAWLEAGGRVLQTPRFAGSGGPYDVDTANEASRTLPASTRSLAFRGGDLGWYLDAEGLKSIDPRLFPR
jgi:hypothetical protein